MEIRYTVDNKCIIRVPSLSNIKINDAYLFPSALKIRLIFRFGIIWSTTIEQLVIDKDVFVTNLTQLDLYSGRKYSRNDEVRLEEKKKSLVP